MKIIKVKCGDRSIPAWVVKTLKGTKKTAPYMFKAVTPDALDNLGDLAAWCQNNGSPASKVVNTGSGRFIKITDPLCRELELANVVKDAEDGGVLDTSPKSLPQDSRTVAQIKQRVKGYYSKTFKLTNEIMRYLENQTNAETQEVAQYHESLQSIFNGLANLEKKLK